MSLPRPSGLPNFIPRKWWKWRPRPRHFHVRKPAAFWVWRKWRDHKAPKPSPAPTPAPTVMFMFDDVNVSLIPKNAQAVAGYADGHWKTWGLIENNFPNAKKLKIAVFAQDDGDCLDVEPGDATPMQAASWINRQLQNWSKSHHDVRRPVVYTNASHGQQLIDMLTKAGFRYGVDYLWWSAHYDPALGQHLCGPRCGFDLRVTAHATQYTDHALNKSLDESVCSPGFFK